MIFQSQNQPKTKENQTFNGKHDDFKPKIKLPTKNPSTQTQYQTQTQIKAAAVATAMESLLLP